MSKEKKVNLAGYEDLSHLGSNTSGDDVYIARKDGKYGIVVADTVGSELCDFHFDMLKTHPGGFLIGWWNGVKDKFGIVAYNGKILMPNILTAIAEPWNDYVKLEADGKYGAFDIKTFYCTKPEFDSIEFDGIDDLVFTKDGVEGYIIEETGEFFSKELRNDEKYIAAHVFTAANYV